MSVRIMSDVLQKSKATLGTRLVLVAISDFADDEGVAYPSIASLQKKALLSERQVQRCIQELVSMGELQVKANCGRNGTNLYRVTVGGCHIDGGGVTFPPQRGDISCNKGVTPMSPESSVDPSIDPSVKPAAKAAGPITFESFLKRCEENQEKPISSYRPVFEYAEKVGIHREFVELAWNEFYRRHAAGGLSEKKRQKDWRHAFRNCLEGNWYKLWWFNEAQNRFELTTAGLTAKRAA